MPNQQQQQENGISKSTVICNDRRHTHCDNKYYYFSPYSSLLPIIHIYIYHLHTHHLFSHPFIIATYSDSSSTPFFAFPHLPIPMPFPSCSTFIYSFHCFSELSSSLFIPFSFAFFLVPLDIIIHGVTLNNAYLYPFLSLSSLSSEFALVPPQLAHYFFFEFGACLPLSSV